MKLQKKVKKYLDQFTTMQRGENTITIFTDNASEELKNSVYQAHGNRLPDDWIFETFESVLESIHDYDVSTIEELENIQGELVDSLIDVYTSDLTAWLNRSVFNVYYLDEAVAEFGAVNNILAMAQYMAINEIFSEVVKLLDD